MDRLEVGSWVFVAVFLGVLIVVSELYGAGNMTVRICAYIYAACIGMIAAGLANR